MRIGLIVIAAFIIALNTTAYAQLFRPYKCGPVLKESTIQMFDSLNQYLEIKPGCTFADIGASSGYYTAAMAVYLDSVTIYLQDIDSSCLNENNLKKVLTYYSGFRETPISQTNDFYLSVGTETKTNLPENSIDIIYSNATYHAINFPDSVLSDIYSVLTQNGTLSIRDEFLNNDEEKYCSDKKCGNSLTKLNDFLETMNRNGFVLVKTTKQFGYPVYTFKKSIKI